MFNMKYPLRGAEDSFSKEEDTPLRGAESSFLLGWSTPPLKGAEISFFNVIGYPSARGRFELN